MALAISPASVFVTPNGRANFSASGGTGPYVFSISSNRSGGSIDPTTGIYRAGPHGLVPDTITVTDSLFTTSSAIAHVSVGLYQNAQRLTGPPSIKQPNGLLIEASYGAEKDVQFERARQGVLASLPTYGDAGALDVIGRERQLPRATDIDGVGIETNAAYGERQRTCWDAADGWAPAGSHASLLYALDRAGFPMGDPDGCHVMQAYVRYSWLTASGGTPVYGTHDPWTYGGVPPTYWSAFSLIFGADVPELTVGSPAAKRLNAIVDAWRDRKARFMGTWIVVSGLAWGWPPGVHHWGDGGLVWGGVVRKIPPM